MKNNALLFLFTFLTIHGNTQKIQNPNTYLKFSGGRVSFGTGDILGYSFAFEGSKDLVKEPTWGFAKLLVGAEFIFENGVRNPVIENPTLDEFFGNSFYHTSNIILWPKASYYPLKKVVKGFNIQIGPTVSYSYRSSEERSSLLIRPPADAYRQSVLQFNNGFNVGYRISTGIEFDLGKQLLTGFRLDFSNNNEAEINTLAGLKIGIKL